VLPVILNGGTGVLSRPGGGGSYTGDNQADGHVSPLTDTLQKDQQQAYRDAVQAQLAAQQAEAEANAAQYKRQQDCQASFTCRNASIVGTVVGAVVGIAVDFVVGAACTAGRIGWVPKPVRPRPELTATRWGSRGVKTDAANTNAAGYDPKPTRQTAHSAHDRLTTNTGKGMWSTH
jgi:hypothetical protein